MEDIGLKGGIKLVGGRKELGCYKQGEPSEQNYGWSTKKRSNCLNISCMEVISDEAGKWRIILQR